MKICKGWLQALLSPAPRGFAARSRVLARLVSLAQIGELARRLGDAMLVLTWMSSNMADGNQQKHLLPSFATKA